MAVSKKLRFEVFRRDGFTCRYCGRTAVDGAVLEPDHVVPRARGGKDVATNLVTACESCNSGKSDTPLESPPIDDVPFDLFRRACNERGITPPAGHLMDTDSAVDEDTTFLAGRRSLAYQVLGMANDWDRRHAVQQALRAAAPHEPTQEELDLCAGVIAAESAFCDLERLCEILMGFLHAIPGGRQTWVDAVAFLKETKDGHLRPTDIIEEAVNRILTSV
ncbi:HNH endonuclease [Actinomadura rubrisoli]|uniref:HNH endonuclease n=1 Tax=Actinomadura rubrisoli TaxID=2530368 RepID=A0A4V2YZL2_9ACTN|nr:HNH endonuclease [Actinomadura rubrisoli]TDD97587.1 HNH endonuclease [Actinomadura rubrisoli]